MISITLLTILIFKIYTSVSSGQENYSLYSTLKFSLEDLTVEKNTFDENSFILLTKSPSNFNKSTETTEIDFHPDSNNTSTFSNMNFLHFHITQNVPKLTVSVIDGNCQFPLIFGTQSKPKFVLNGDFWKLEIMDDFSDFRDNYGTSQTVSNNLYTTAKAGSEFKYINILCPFYNKVTFFNCFKIKTNIIRRIQKIK